MIRVLVWGMTEFGKYWWEDQIRTTSFFSLSYFVPFTKREQLQGLFAKGSESISSISGNPGGLPSLDSDLWMSHSASEDPERVAGMLSERMRAENDGEPRGQVRVWEEDFIYLRAFEFFCISFSGFHFQAIRFQLQICVFYQMGVCVCMCIFAWKLL